METSFIHYSSFESCSSIFILKEALSMGFCGGNGYYWIWFLIIIIILLCCCCGGGGWGFGC